MRATESLTLTQNPHSVFFLEENLRLYASYCATVSQPLFSASAKKFYHIHLVYTGYHENVPVNFMTNWLRRGVPVSKPLLVAIWQKNISDLFASLAISTRPSRLVIRLSHIQAWADRLQWLKNTPLQLDEKQSCPFPSPVQVEPYTKFFFR